MAGVRLEGVSKRYGAVEAVRDVNLEVFDHEFLVLLGPSGCGKTTTLRMVAGLEEVSAGRIRIGDRDVTDLPPKDRDIAMVFQNYALYPHMTVFDNMAFGLKLRHVPQDQIRKRVEETAAMLGLDGLLARRPKELSGGQRQRVALGRAIVRNPQAFLMDEPLSNLDAKLRTQTRVELKRLQQRLGTTVLYVTHDQVEAMTMGDRIVVMKDGAVQQVDTPEGIYRRPRNMFVATFVGSPVMNLIRARVERKGDDLLIRVGDETVNLAGSLKQRVQAATGREVVVGVRPEDAHINPGFLAHAAMTVDAKVEAVEPLGYENILYTTVGGQALTIRAAHDWKGQPGDRVRVGLDPEAMQVFDPESELTLTLSA